MKVTSGFLMVLVALLLASSLNAFSLHDPPPLAEIDHEVVVNEYGYTLVNGTVTLENPSPESTPLASLTLLYPEFLRQHTASHMVRSPAQSLVIERDKGFTKLTVSMPTGYTLEARGRAAVSFSLYLVGVITPLGEGEYRFLMPTVPSMELVVQEVRSTLTLPRNTKLVQAPEGFKKVEGAATEAWKGVFRDVPAGEPRLGNLTLRSQALESALIEFPYAERRIELSPLGEFMVNERIRVVNADDEPLTFLRIHPLNKGVREVTVLPPEEPPFTNAFRARLTERGLELATVLRRPLGAGEQATLSFEYPLSLEAARVEGGVMSINVSTAPPVDGVVGTFTLTVEPGAHRLVSPGASLITQVNASSLTARELRYLLRPTLGWAAGEVMPVASFVFATSLAFLLLLRFRRIEPESARFIIDLRGTLEERVAETGRFLSTLEAAAPGEISRRELEDVRRGLEDLRTRMASKASTLKSRLLPARPDLQSLFEELAEVERDYDRGVKDLYGAYRQYQLAKLKGRAFERQRAEHRKRLDRAEQKLMKLSARLSHEGA